MSRKPPETPPLRGFDLCRHVRRPFWVLIGDGCNRAGCGAYITLGLVFLPDEPGLAIPVPAVLGRNTMKLQLLVVTATLATIISGCGTAPPAVPGSSSRKIGDDMYIIQIESTVIGVANKKIWLFDQANAHCAYLGKKVENPKVNQNRGGLIGDFVLDIEYKCIPK